MNKLWIAAMLGAAVALAGCAIPVTEVLPIGPDTYFVATRHPTSSGDARVAALKAAGQYCAKIGKNILVTDISPSGGGMLIYNIDMNFRCLSASDPDLKRPNLETRPDVVIQDRR